MLTMCATGDIGSVSHSQFCIVFFLFLPSDIKLIILGLLTINLNLIVNFWKIND